MTLERAPIDKSAPRDLATRCSRYVARSADGPDAVLDQIAALAREAPTSLRLLEVRARYALSDAALVLEAGEGRRLWAAALGAALRAAGGLWTVLLDGPAAGSALAGEEERRALSAAMRAAFGDAEADVLAFARAPGDPEPLAPRLQQAPTHFAGAPPFAALDLAPPLAAMARRACRVRGVAPIASIGVEGRPALSLGDAVRRRWPGVSVYAPTS